MAAGPRLTITPVTGAGGVFQVPGKAGVDFLLDAQNIYGVGDKLVARPGSKIISQLGSDCDEIVPLDADTLFKKPTDTYWRPFVVGVDVVELGDKIAYGLVSATDKTYPDANGRVPSGISWIGSKAGRTGYTKVLSASISGELRPFCFCPLGFKEHDTTSGNTHLLSPIGTSETWLDAWECMAASGWAAYVTGARFSPPATWPVENLYTAAATYETGCYLVLEAIGGLGAQSSIPDGTWQHDSGSLGLIDPQKRPAFVQLHGSAICCIASGRECNDGIVIDTGAGIATFPEWRWLIGTAGLARGPAPTWASLIFPDDVTRSIWFTSLAGTAHPGNTLTRAFPTNIRGFCTHAIYLTEVNAWYGVCPGEGLMKLLAHKLTGGVATADDIDASGVLLNYLELGDWAIGVSAPYDSNVIALHNRCPAPSVLGFYRNCLWSGGDLTEPGIIRISAPVPYQDVWPALSYESFSGTPTAMVPLGDTMTIYTRNSIHIAVPNTVDDYGIGHYIIDIRVQNGGCVSTNTVVDLSGRHVFLGEGFVGMFDGGTELVRVSHKDGFNRLAKVFERMARFNQDCACACAWPNKTLYMLAVAEESEYNTTVLVWDWQRDAWWIWRGLNVQRWVVDPTGSDTNVYFIDRYSRLHQLVPRGDTEETAFEAYAQTDFVSPKAALDTDLYRTTLSHGPGCPVLQVSLMRDGDERSALDYTSYTGSSRDFVLGTSALGTGTLTVRNVRRREAITVLNAGSVGTKVAGDETFSLRSIELITSKR